MTSDIVQIYSRMLNHSRTEMVIRLTITNKAALVSEKMAHRFDLLMRLFIFTKIQFSIHVLSNNYSNN